MIGIGDGGQKGLNRMSFTELFEVAKESKDKLERGKAMSILHKNAALGFSPFFVCLLLVPIATKSARKETIYNLFMGILICVSFYTIGTIGSNFFEKYSWNYIAWWLPNIIFLISSLFLSRNCMLK